MSIPHGETQNSSQRLLRRGTLQAKESGNGEGVVEVLKVSRLMLHSRYILVSSTHVDPVCPKLAPHGYGPELAIKGSLSSDVSTTSDTLRMCDADFSLDELTTQSVRRLKHEA